MIRYRCDSCGKSLRADNAIIDCKAKCTRCGEVMTVPQTSTRKSAGQPVVPPENPPASEPQSGESQSEVPEIAVPTIRVDLRQFARAPKSNRKWLASATAALFILLVVFAIWFGMGSKPAASKFSAEFKQTPAFVRYRTSLETLKKSQTRMIIMSDGYLHATGNPKSDMQDSHVLNSKIESAVNQEQSLQQANELFLSGELEQADLLLKSEIENLNQLRERAIKLTEELNEKTHAGI